MWRIVRIVVVIVVVGVGGRGTTRGEALAVGDGAAGVAGGGPAHRRGVGAAENPARRDRARTRYRAGWWRGRRWADDDDVGGRDVRDSSCARVARPRARGRDAKSRARRVAHISAQRDTRAGVAARAVAKASIKTPRRASAPRRSSSEPSVRNRVDQSSWVTWHAIPIRAASPSPPPRPDVKARRASPRARIPLFRVA